MTNQKTILLTGATGFLGSRLLKAFVNARYTIAVLKRRSSALTRIASEAHAVRFFDIEDGLERPFEQMGHIDAIVHTATSYGRNGEPVTDVFEANTVLPVRLLELAAFFNAGTFLNTDTILHKYVNVYALSKQHVAEWGRLFAESGKLNFVNLRLEHMYGAGDDAKKFVTHIVRSCLSNVPELHLTKGEQRRDFVHIDDVVSAYVLLLEKVGQLTPGFHQFEIGSGDAVSIRDFVSLVHQAAVSSTLLRFGALPYREHELMDSQADISSLYALGWVHKYSLETGIRQVIEAERNGA